MNVRMNNAVTIKVPSELTSNKWIAEDYNLRKTYSIPEVAATILMYCAKSRNTIDLLSSVSGLYKLNYNEAELILENLMKANLITPSNNEPKLNSNSNCYLRNINKYSITKWRECIRYHYFTLDYPFLDYSEGADGWEIANERMNKYSNEKSDNERSKSYAPKYNAIELPNALNEKGTELNNKIMKNINSLTHLDKVSIITTVAFKKTGEASIPWKGTPLMRRTSPSGGSRHPTEGYIITSLNNKIKKLYHIQSSPFCLRELSTISDGTFNKLLHDINSDEKKPSAIIILTSVFGRNMFRYREPRTFRTVHMDVGHILGTIEIIAREINTKTQITHNLDTFEVEKILGVDGLFEGFMSSIEIY